MEGRFRVSDEVSSYRGDTLSDPAGGKEAWCVWACVIGVSWVIGRLPGFPHTVFSQAATVPVFLTMTAANPSSQWPSDNLTYWK